MSKYEIETNGAVFVRKHDGYCSDSGEVHETSYPDVIKYTEIPSKGFLNKYCDEYGNIDSSGFMDISTNDYEHCSNGCIKTREYVISSAKLVRKDNILDECLNDMSSDSEPEPEPEPEPQYIMDRSLGIVRYIPNPRYNRQIAAAVPVVNKKKPIPFTKNQLDRRAKIDCIYGSNCRRHKNGTCHFKH